jgi:hypothetical protein
MKVVIIYQQHKVTIESSKEIKVKDVFKYFRSEYPIGLRENLLLVKIMYNLILRQYYPLLNLFFLFN